MAYKLIMTLTLLFIAAICILGVIGVEHGLIPRFEAGAAMVALGIGSFFLLRERI